MQAEVTDRAQIAGESSAVVPWWHAWVRRKGHLGPIALTVLTIVACVPFLLVFTRMLALPGGEALPFSGAGPLHGLGEFLNQELTFEWVPPSDRSAILYLLLIPTGALLITLARLTLGVRILGLRAILIAIGLQAIGIGPSLALMAVVIGMIIAVRPWIRRIRLPLYGRIAVILSLSAMMMIGALLLAPWLGSESVWRVAFFPVIIMAMLAEGVAKTIEQNSKVMAIWRAGWTIVLALVIALIARGASQITFHFPELTLTQLAGIIFIAEFFDLRLLEKWPDRLTRYFDGVRPWYHDKPRVAVVRNRETANVIGRLGRPAPRDLLAKSVQRHVDALREQGFEVKVFEGDAKMLGELGAFLKADPRWGTPGGIVFNLATGLQGSVRHSHVPAMLEMAGLPYTGPDPAGHACLSDRWTLLNLLERARVAVPRHVLLTDPSAPIDVEFPCAVRPRQDPDVKRIVARDEHSLRQIAREVRRELGQPIVIEEIVSGREIRVAMLGNQTLECLPLIEYAQGPGGKIVPAPLREDIAERIRACANDAFRAAGCRDYARIDLRLPTYGDPVVIDVQWYDLFAGKGSFVLAAAARGLSFGQLMRRIVEEAARRHVNSSTGSTDAVRPSTVVSLDERRAAMG